MIFWNSNKGGFAGGAKTFFKGIFPTFISVTSEAPDTPDCVLALTGQIVDTLALSNGTIDDAATALSNGTITEVLALSNGTIDDSATALTGTLTEVLALSSGTLCQI